MKRVYIAGKLNSDACGYIVNVHKMIMAAENVRKLGFAVFVPGLDFLQGLVFGNWEYKNYFESSQPWLDASDAIFLTPGWQTSEGTKREIEHAKSRSIPVFDDLKELAKAMGDLH